jgi:hypothetical protein
MFFIKTIIGYQKTQNFILILNSLKCAKENVPKKNVRLKTRQILSIQEFSLFLLFFTHNFFQNLVSSVFQPVWNQYKNQRFLYPILIFLRKFLLVIFSLFANFECICSKNSTPF